MKAESDSATQGCPERKWWDLHLNAGRLATRPRLHRKTGKVGEGGEEKKLEQGCKPWWRSWLDSVNSRDLREETDRWHLYFPKFPPVTTCALDVTMCKATTSSVLQNKLPLGRFPSNCFFLPYVAHWFIKPKTASPCFVSARGIGATNKQTEGKTRHPWLSLPFYADPSSKKLQPGEPTYHYR